MRTMFNAAQHVGELIAVLHLQLVVRIEHLEQEATQVDKIVQLLPAGNV